jgi:hypothetical protein
MQTESSSERSAADLLPPHSSSPDPATRVLLDLRTYTLVTGRLNEYLEIYRKEGLPVQVRHLGKPFGFFVSETGPQDQIVHLWAYQSAADRANRRKALAADPAWRAFIAKTGSYFRNRETRLLENASFWPLS